MSKADDDAAPTLVHLEKTRPVQVLESRRKALEGWVRDGQVAINAHEAEIKRHKQEAIEMTDEIAEIEQALNVLNGAAVPGEHDGSRE